MSAQRVFLDANVIIEAFRISAWTELSKAYCLETIQECESEALTGDTSRFGFVAVDASSLKNGLRHSHPVEKKDRNALIKRNANCLTMDPGEKDLFAYLLTLQQPLPTLIVVSTADKGVVVRAHEMGWLDHLVSLEELLKSCGTSSRKVALLQLQHQASFLSNVRTKVFQGVIP